MTQEQPPLGAEIDRLSAQLDQLRYQHSLLQAEGNSLRAALDRQCSEADERTRQSIEAYATAARLESERDALKAHCERAVALVTEIIGCLDQKMIDRHDSGTLAAFGITHSDSDCSLCKARALIKSTPAQSLAEHCALVLEEAGPVIVRRIAELPDRTSPDDQPEMMLVSGAELIYIIASVAEERREKP